MKLLVTGSHGLIGSELVEWFCKEFDLVVGIDNNMRREFFCAHGDTTPVKERLIRNHKNYIHKDLDIRNEAALNSLFQEEQFDAVFHCAAQPSHDLAAKIPIIDFHVNALGTLHLLEAARKFAPNCVFVFTSTNKVYGDQPNFLPLCEQETRWEYAREEDKKGINESMSIDHCTHSVFGVSKVAADLMVQEYGRNFGLKTVVFRGGCLTGPNHRGAELHGFLSYLARANIERIPYTIFGYKGKQVRDNIHSVDVCSLFSEVLKKPVYGEAFNLGGGKENSCSMLEAIQKIETITGIQMDTTYNKTNRVGDHICYYTDLSKIQKYWPNWKITKSLDTTIKEICDSWQKL